MTSSAIRLMGVALVLLAGAAVAYGDVMVVNPNFEEPVLSDGTATSIGTGWELSSAAGVVNTMDATFAGTTYVSPSQPGYMPGSASGLQCAYMDPDPETQCHIYQNVGPMSSGKTYTLTAAIGRQLNPAMEAASWIMYLRYDNAGTIETLAELANTDPGAVLPGLGQFVDNTISWTNTAGLSGDMYVVFRALNVSNSEVCIDHVRLTETPEPMSMLILLTGIVGLMAYAWRKRN